MKAVVQCISVATLLTVLGSAALPTARADTVAYLVNVTVRPGYNFASAEHALSYGNSICSRMRDGQTYSQLVTDIKVDFATTDDYQASYLIAQAVNELCPALIWQLRRSAADYRPSAFVAPASTPTEKAAP
ncbi:DUF732 domain-containing protein [Mycolicibacterium sp. BiH015]|uniref:DUF732 domain-containing protein n=1 Tax=Mycolicibacterium sp. BiH015 TaxID=3018808 RepID=UPI0022DE9E2C|nr:DUF732 domain-containing protein [Mycolicibacterium sp. BiH015]MDA2893247.1 DUF732 domain-containing protein [Mycolicibacterium sp. BiH015]